jgi:glycosyltransferase involved in cell wall biosynthesis
MVLGRAPGMKLSVIIPAFNEMKTIGQVTSLVKGVRLDCDKEILIVNDGSRDKTHEIASKIPGVRYIRLEKNMGKGAAVQYGIRNATGDLMIIQDADLEYLPEDIPKIISPILKGEADVVYGSRFLGSISGMSTRHLAGNLVLTFTTRLLCGIKLTDMMTGYKAFTRAALDGVRLTGRRFELEPEITVKLAQKKLRFAEVPITYEHRKNSRAKIKWIDGIKCLWYLVFTKIQVVASHASKRTDNS